MTAFKRLQIIFILLLLMLVGLLFSQSSPLVRYFTLFADQTPSAKVSFLDVGQGDAILVTTPNDKHILVDGGPDSTVLTRLGEHLPFNKRTLDLVIATHNDADHITGLIEVLERYRVEQLWINGAVHTTNTYITFLETIKGQNIIPEIAYNGKITEIDGMRIEVLYPPESQEGARPSEQNSASIVILVTFGEHDFLLTGDIAEPEEQAMLRSEAAVSAEVLKVPHHGSASGLALNFLNQVNPRYAVISVGQNNRFGHPAPSILQKLQNIDLYRTDVHGTVEFTTDGANLSVSVHTK